MCSAKIDFTCDGGAGIAYSSFGLPLRLASPPITGMPGNGGSAAWSNDGKQATAIANTANKNPLVLKEFPPCILLNRQTMKRGIQDFKRRDVAK